MNVFNDGDILGDYFFKFKDIGIFEGHGRSEGCCLEPS